MTPFKRTMWELAHLWLQEHAPDAAPTPDAPAVTRLRDLLISAHDMGAKTTEHHRQMERELFTEAMKTRPAIIHLHTPEGVSVLVPKEEPEPAHVCGRDDPLDECPDCGIAAQEPRCECGNPWVAMLENGARLCGGCLNLEHEAHGLEWGRILWRRETAAPIPTEDPTTSYTGAKGFKVTHRELVETDTLEQALKQLPLQPRQCMQFLVKNRALLVSLRDTHTQMEIAKMFGVSQASVSRALRAGMGQ